MSLFVVRIVFIVLAVLAFLFTIVAIATPAWRSVTIGGTLSVTVGSVSVSQSINLGYSFGLVSATCSGMAGSGSCGSDLSSKDYAKAAMAMMIIALLCEIGMIGFAAFLCFKKATAIPLPILALCAFVFVLVGVAVFGAKSNDDVSALSSLYSVYSGITITNTIGYSIIMGILAIVCLVADTVVGVFFWKYQKLAY